MALSSRNMPPATAHGSWRSLVILALILVGIAGIASVCYGPIVFALLAGFFVALMISGWAVSHRFRMLAEAREGESICTFVRSFDWRSVDTWIIRATYEELDSYLGGKLPIRASDSFEKTYEMDPDDLDMLIEDIASRAGRSLENPRMNPCYGKINTVHDLVLCLNHQPRVRADKSKSQDHEK